MPQFIFGIPADLPEIDGYAVVARDDEFVMAIPLEGGPSYYVEEAGPGSYRLYQSSQTREPVEAAVARMAGRVTL